MVNCYLEAAPPGAKSLVGVPSCFGIEDWITVGTGPIRGGIVINNIPYVVSGTKLYRVTSVGSTIELGNIPGVARVSMAGDEVNIMVVVDNAGYYYNGSTVEPIADEDFPGAEWVENLDGYFVIGAPASGKFYVSANRNPGSWDGLEFATAEKYPDDLVRGIAIFGEIVLFGRESGEAWYNSGDSDFPLDRVSTGFFEKGCMSRFGPAKADNRVFFPGHDGIVYALNGYQPERISTYAVEQAIEAATDKEFIGLSWSEAGHTFYALTCTHWTFVYDCSTGLWHERQSYSQDNWRAAVILRAFNKWLVCDADSNKIGQLTAAAFSEWGDVLRTSCTAPAVTDDNKRIFHSRLELTFEQGTGLVSGQGSDPQIMLRWSDDGGRTWSGEHWRGLGGIGEFRKRAMWNRLGQSRDRVYEYAISDPVRRTLMFATLEASGGAY
jgi:hypothetical protein